MRITSKTKVILRRDFTGKGTDGAHLESNAMLDENGNELGVGMHLRRYPNQVLNEVRWVVNKTPYKKLLMALRAAGHVVAGGSK